MRSVLSSLYLKDSGWILPVLMMVVVASVLLSPPVRADDYGYTEGAPLGAPNWLLERMDTSSLPEYYLPRNTTGEQVNVPTASSYISSGNNLLVSGSFADAKLAFENAVQLKPGSYDAWVGRGLALEGLKRYQTAIDSYEKAIGFAPDDGSSWIAYGGKGRVSLELNKYQDASDALERAIDEYARSGASNMDDLSSLYSHLAEAKNKLGLNAEATAAKEKVQTLKSATGSVFKNSTS